MSRVVCIAISSRQVSSKTYAADAEGERAAGARHVLVEQLSEIAEVREGLDWAANGTRNGSELSSYLNSEGLNCEISCVAASSSMNLSAHDEAGKRVVHGPHADLLARLDRPVDLVSPAVADHRPDHRRPPHPSEFQSPDLKNFEVPGPMVASRACERREFPQRSPRRRWPQDRHGACCTAVQAIRA